MLQWVITQQLLVMGLAAIVLVMGIYIATIGDDICNYALQLLVMGLSAIVCTVQLLVMGLSANG